MKAGENYYIIPTTAFGLYRYHISDVVRCTGFFNQTPLVEFLSKGSHFSNMTGEKLSEYHVTKTMERILRSQNVSLTAYSVAPCWNDDRPYYGLFIERTDIADPDSGAELARRPDAGLCESNME